MFMDDKLIREIEGTNSGIQLLALKPRILEALKGEEKKKGGGK